MQSMNFTNPCCPECKKPAIGTFETIDAVAWFDGDPSKGPVDYEGSTEVWWDSQKTQKDIDDRVGLVCACGEIWYSNVIEVRKCPEKCGCDSCTTA